MKREKSARGMGVFHCSVNLGYRMNPVEYLVAAGIALAEKYERRIAELTTSTVAAETESRQTDDMQAVIEATERLRNHCKEKGFNV